MAKGLPALGAALLLGPALGLSDGTAETDGAAEMEGLAEGVTDGCPDMLGSWVGVDVGDRVVGEAETGGIVGKLVVGAGGVGYERKEEVGVGEKSHCLNSKRKAVPHHGKDFFRLHPRAISAWMVPCCRIRRRTRTRASSYRRGARAVAKPGVLP